MKNHTSTTNYFVYPRMFLIIFLTIIFMVMLIGVAHMAYDVVLFTQNNVHLPTSPHQ